MTKNWYLLIAWLFVAAIALVEFGNNYVQYGLFKQALSIKTWIFALLFLTSLFFILRLRKLRNQEKLQKSKPTKNKK